MKSLALFGSVLLFSACTASSIAMTTTPKQVAVGHYDVMAGGDPVEGRALFTKLRCDMCHSVAGQATRAPHPLPDLTAQPPDAVANLIVERSDIAPEALFDEMAMSSALSNMTLRDLAHLVAYLRNPSAAGRARTK